MLVFLTEFHNCFTSLAGFGKNKNSEMFGWAEKEEKRNEKNSEPARKGVLRILRKKLRILRTS